MYLITTVEGDDMRLDNLVPWGPHFSVEDMDKAVKMETWGSSCKDVGTDYVQYRLFDADGKIIAKKRVEGY